MMKGNDDGDTSKLWFLSDKGRNLDSDGGDISGVSQDLIVCLSCGDDYSWSE